MASQQSSLHDHANRPGSSTKSVPLPHGSPLLDSALWSTRETASTTKLPSALGLGSSSSYAPVTSSAGRTNASSLGWTVTGSSAGATRSANNTTNGSHWTRSTLVTSSSLSPELPDATTSTPSIGGEGSPADGQRNQLSTHTTPHSSLDKTASGPMQASGVNGSTRNFLIPIGATGARQKLSILSAAQRSSTSTSAAGNSPQQGSDMPLQRNVNPLDPWSGRRRPTTSGEGSRATSFGNDRLLLQDRTAAVTGDHNRSSSTGRYDHASPSTLHATSENGDATTRRSLARGDMPGMHRAASWQTASGTGPQSSSLQERQASSSTLGRAAVGLHQPWIEGNGDANGSAQSLTLSNGRNDETDMQRQNRRPASSAGRERAAKIGAGFKNMFGSRSGKEGSPKGVIEGGGSPLGNRNAQLRPHQLHDTSFQPDKKGQGAATAIDPESAQSAGWTALLDRESAREQSVQTAPITQHKRKPSLLSRRTEEKGVGDRSPRSRMSDTPPSIDLELPAMGGLFGSFATDQLFPYNATSEEGAGSRGARNAKGVPTTGLNLEVAGQTFPSNEYAAEVGPEEGKATTSQDKSLPPTPAIDDWDKKSIPLGQREGPLQTWAGVAEAPGPGNGPATVFPTSAAPMNSPLFDRIASLSSTNDSSRRGSTTTTTNSDGHDAAAETPSRSNTSVRSTMDNRTSSSGESTYSAPNSSRAWSPVTSDKPSVPITSPLLASLMSQHVHHQQQQQHHQGSMSDVGVQQKKGVSPLSTSSVPAGEPSLTSPKLPSTSTLSSISPRPDLPAKSSNRQSMALQPDAATLAKLENGRPLQRRDQAPSNAAKSSSETVTAREKEPGKAQSTYVPPGALTYTRKGTAVRPTGGKAALDALVSDKPVSSTNHLEPVPPPTSANKSRFSGASSDTTSSPHSSVRQTGRDAEMLGTSSGGAADGQIISFTSNDYDSYEDEGAIDVVSLLPASAWTEVEAALGQFKAMSMPNAAPSDKGGLLRSILLPFLALEAETANFEVSGTSHFHSGKARRALFFEWIQHLLLELQTVQTSADRGAILESIACIIESRNFSASMFQTDEDDETKFYSVFGHILSYAIGELNKKGVYQNTLIFSGRLLAVAFFRIDGVASKLLRALPVNRFALERVAAEIDWENSMPRDWEAYKQWFPPTLHDFCFQDARSYLKMLDSQTAALLGDEQNDDDRFLVRQSNVEVEMSGNWLRRWQSDDSELFFSFCRSYHRQLSALVIPHRGSATMGNLFFGGPGYAHLATCIHQKCLSLVHRDILSVTTLSSQKNFNPGETANVLSGSTAGKPRHLEAANRRCTAIVVDIVRAPSASSLQTFGPMLSIHIKCLIKRTSLYDVQGVFCLLDWLDGVLNHMESVDLPIERLVDVEFVIQTIWLLLKDADHALALMRTIAFCYSNFAILTSTSKNRIRFCEEILLHPRIFQKLFLSWSFTIRAYFLHLLVFRLARINDFPQPEEDTKGKTAISVARLFNQRLDEIRRRHDELSPTASSADSVSDEEMEQVKMKARPQSFVSTIKHTSPPSAQSDSPGSLKKAEKLLGIGPPDPAMSSKGESKAQSRAAKWLRALGAKGTGKGQKRMEASLMGSPYLGASPVSEGKPFSASEDRDEEEETHKRLADSANEASAKQGKGDWQEERLGIPDTDEKGVGTHTSEGVFEFSFEARNSQPDGKGEARFEDDDDTEEEKAANEHISRKLSFDLQSPTSALPPPSAQNITATGGEEARGAGGKLTVSGSLSRVSKAFNRRQSLLPGPAFNLVTHQADSEDEEGGEAAAGAVNDELSGQADKKRGQQQQEMLAAEPYNQTLHIYAVQSLREYEQTVLEHDEFFAKQADADNPQVPRLPIQWPAMWSE